MYVQPYVYTIHSSQIQYIVLYQRMYVYLHRHFLNLYFSEHTREIIKTTQKNILKNMYNSHLTMVFKRV